MNVVLLRSNPVDPCPRTEKTARCLAKHGWGVTVLAWDRERDAAPREEKMDLGGTSCRIVRFCFRGQFGGGIRKNLKGLLRFQRFLYQWLRDRQNEYDAVHALDLDTAFTAQRAARRFGKTFVYDIADYYSSGHGYRGMLRRICNRIENSVIDRAYAVLLCTEERKEEIQGANPRRLYVIHNTPDLCVPPCPPSPHDRLRLAYIGVFGRTRFLPELTEFVSSRRDCELHIGGFGAGMEPYFEQMASRHDNIFFYGRVPYEKALQIEQSCDVLPILYDPSLLNHLYAAPNKFYEALALGKPMIMTKGMGISAVVEAWDLGETMEYSLQGLNAAVDRLIARKDQWPQIAARERELYDTRYSWQEMERRLCALYDEIARAR